MPRSERNFDSREHQTQHSFLSVEIFREIRALLTELGTIEKNPFLPEFVQTSLIANRTVVEADEFTNVAEIAQVRKKILNLRGESDVPLVSIVVPAYNEEKVLFAFLHSVAQNNVVLPTEVIVVVNNTTDRTAEIAKASGAQVIEYSDPSIAGAAHARQVGLEVAKGKYILASDADVIVPPNWIGLLTEPLINNVDVSVVTSHKFVMYSLAPKSVALSMPYNRMRAIKMRRGTTVTNGRPTGSSMGYRTQDALNSGGYDITAKYSEDTKIGRQLVEYGRLFFVDDPQARVWTSPRRYDELGALLTLYASITNQPKLLYDDGETMLNIR